MKTIKFRSWICRITIEDYPKGNKRINLTDAEDGMPIATATVWIPGLEKDEFAIKDYSENEGMLDALVSLGIIDKPHRQLEGFPIVRLIA